MEDDRVDFSYVYENKKRFVDLLSEAYAIDSRTAQRIIYTRDPEKNLEFVHIEWYGGHIDRINVTSNSHIAIGREVANQLSGIDAVGLIK